MKTINLKNAISENVVTRESLRQLLVTVSESTVFDFSQVEFMSRSCADEFLKFKESSKFTISEKNVSKDVKAMLAAAANTRAQPPLRKVTFTPLKAIASL